MRNTRVLVYAGIVPCTVARSSESLQRTGYETLQNAGEQYCEKDLSADSPGRESCEDYRRKRQELENGH